MTEDEKKTIEQKQKRDRDEAMNRSVQTAARVSNDAANAAASAATAAAIAAASIVII